MVTRPMASGHPRATGSRPAQSLSAALRRGIAALTHPQSTFGEQLQGRDNAFGLLRLMLAIAVICSHAFYLGTWPDDPLRHLTRGQTDLGNLAVLGFFTISGYLITQSAMRLGAIDYLWRRALRILPGFAVALLVTALVISPWFYHRDHGTLSGFLSGPHGALAYLRHNALLRIGQDGIHDVFLDTPYGRRQGFSSVNGSLWTLWHEFRCYILVGALALLGVLRRWRWVVPVLAGGLLVLQLIIRLFPAAGVLGVSVLGQPLVSIFLLGASVAVYPDRVPFSGRLAALAGVIMVLTMALGGFMFLGYPALAYLVLWAAAALPGWARRIGARNDISYGVYVYAWPIQMALASYGIVWYPAHVWLTMVLVFPLAWLSWTLVERPAMALKDKDPLTVLRTLRRGRTRG